MTVLIPSCSPAKGFSLAGEVQCLSSRCAHTHACARTHICSRGKVKDETGNHLVHLFPSAPDAENRTPWSLDPTFSSSACNVKASPSGLAAFHGLRFFFNIFRPFACLYRFPSSFVFLFPAGYAYRARFSFSTGNRWRIELPGDSPWRWKGFRIMGDGFLLDQCSSNSLRFEWFLLQISWCIFSTIFLPFFSSSVICTEGFRG